MRITNILWGVFIVLSMLITPSVYGQTTAFGTEKQAVDENKWKFSVTPYIWGVNLDGKVTVGDYSSSSSASFSDIAGNLRTGGQVHLEAWRGNFGFFVDPTYLKLRKDTTVTDVRSGAAPLSTRDLTLTAEMWLIEFGGFYRAGKWLMDGKKEGRIASIDLLAGGRYWYTRMELDTSGTVNPSKTNQFVDPIIGARASIDLTDRIGLILRSDAGGFGAGSDFTWNNMVCLGYRFNSTITVLLGYRHLYMDYKAGTSRARYDITMQGPMAGISFEF